jgi:hypothetical protein
MADRSNARFSSFQTLCGAASARVNRIWVGDMAFLSTGARALDYSPCRYGQSRLTFRGPKQTLDQPYLVALGGAETYGKYIERPWPALLARHLEMPVVNLGCVNGGIDTYLRDPSLIEIAARAQHVVVQATGVQSLSNPFYTVHSRRNDRFLRPEAPLRALYPEVDFTEFAFTRHLVGALHDRGAERFGQVAEALQATWVRRMGRLLDALGKPPTLLWIATQEPPTADAPPQLGSDPMLLHAGMIAALQSRLAAVVTVVAPNPPRHQAVDMQPVVAAAAALGLPDLLPAEGMTAAMGLPGLEAHEAAAAALADRMACHA